MDGTTFRDVVRKLTKAVGGRLPDSQRLAVRAVLDGKFDPAAAEAVLADVAAFVESITDSATVQTVLVAAKKRDERRGAGSTQFDDEALRRATIEDDDGDEHDTADGGADDRAEGAGVSDPVAGLD